MYGQIKGSLHSDVSYLSNLPVVVTKSKPESCTSLACVKNQIRRLKEILY